MTETVEYPLGTRREDNLYPVGDPRRTCQMQAMGSSSFGPYVGDPQPLPPGGRAVQPLGWSGTSVPYGDMIIGTCSKCRGPVCVPSIWSVAMPVPTCQQCGAKKKASYGPIIEME